MSSYRKKSARCSWEAQLIRPGQFRERENVLSALLVDQTQGSLLGTLQRWGACGGNRRRVPAGILAAVLKEPKVLGMRVKAIFMSPIAKAESGRTADQPTQTQ